MKWKPFSKYWPCLISIEYLIFIKFLQVPFVKCQHSTHIYMHSLHQDIFHLRSVYCNIMHAYFDIISVWDVIPFVLHEDCGMWTIHLRQRFQKYLPYHIFTHYLYWKGILICGVKDIICLPSVYHPRFTECLSTIMDKNYMDNCEKRRCPTSKMHNQDHLQGV